MTTTKKEQVRQKLEKFLTRFPEIDPNEWIRRRDVWSISEKFLKKLPQMNDKSFERHLYRLVDDFIDIRLKSINDSGFDGKLSNLADALEEIRTSSL